MRQVASPCLRKTATTAVDEVSRPLRFVAVGRFGQFVPITHPGHFYDARFRHYPALGDWHKRPAFKAGSLFRRPPSRLAQLRPRPTALG